MIEPKKFRKRPVVIEAVQFAGDVGAPEIAALDFACGREGDLDVLYIETMEGRMTARAGDWIIKGVRGEFYPCKPDIFEATYEPADQSSSLVVSPETVAEIKRLLIPSGPRPCDCDRCDCGNVDDAQQVAAWDEQNGLASTVLDALLLGAKEEA